MEATEQIRALAVEGPIIRSHLRICISKGKVGSIEEECINAISDSVETIHVLWSEFIGERVFETHEESTMKDYYKALERTLTNTTRQEVFSLSRKYLSYALTRRLEDQEIGYFFTIWNHFIQHLVQHDPPSFDWRDMSKYIMTITRNESMDGFVSPAHLSAVAPYIMRPSARYSPILRHFFSIPTLKFDRTEDRHAIFRAELVYSRKHDWSLYHAASYAVPFARALSGRKLDTRSSEGTVLLSEAWMSLYRVADYAIMNYRRGNGLTAGGIGLTASIRNDLLAVAERSIQFLNSNRTSINTQIQLEFRYDMLHAAFNIVHSVGVDRYCKRAVHLAWALSDAPWRLDLYNSCSSFFQNDVRIRNGINDSAYIPHFQNAPYLRRFKIHGSCFITSFIFRQRLPSRMLASYSQALPGKSTPRALH
ncbi:hypothetical protein SCHPADRAFT_617242 [Schizopora paradoxa]|uniref:Uncharacterized protein n=1 Tax=Schizopora paradoxa TaxID=27342 RepID=A0A0H2RTN4_9AGAM|nr:hypothetical protein SCHPADRAFT_617242 [Schizopora paradoxa]